MGMTSRIYHGGASGKMRGWPAGGGGSTYLYERIWIPAEQFAPLSSNPPNGPNTRVFPNTVNAYSYFFAADQLDLIYHWFCLPSRYWTGKLSAPTDCKLRLYWYTENTSGDNIRWKAELNIVRDSETMDFAPPALGTYDAAAGTANYLHIQELTNFPINDPSGAGTNVESAFYLKLGRDGADAADTFTSEAYLIGASVEIPLT
jgi:hypothetical protein